MKQTSRGFDESHPDVCSRERQSQSRLVLWYKPLACFLSNAIFEKERLRDEPKQAVASDSSFVIVVQLLMKFNFERILAEQS